MHTSARDQRSGATLGYCRSFMIWPLTMSSVSSFTMPAVFNPLTTSGSSIPISLLTLNSKPGKPFPYPHHPVHACVLGVPTFQQHLTAGLGNPWNALCLASETPYSHGSPLNVGFAWTSELSLFSLLKVQVTQSCLTPSDPMDCSPPDSSVRGVLQARILEWVAIPFSRKSSQPRDRTEVSCIAGRFFTIWATRDAFSLF